LTDSNDSHRDERNVTDAMRSAGPVRPNPEFRERLKREFVSGAIAEGRAGAAIGEVRASWLSYWPWIAAPAAAVAGLLLVVIGLRPAGDWSVVGVTGSGQLRIDEQVLSAARDSDLPSAFGFGSRLSLDDSVALALKLDERVLLELDEGADVLLPEDPGARTDGLLVAEVRSGELRVKTGPSFPGHRLEIRTVDGLAAIDGTMVSVFRGNDLTCVCVLEGTARIGVDDANLELVPPGMRKVMFTDGRPSMVTEIEPHHAEGLQGFVERYRDVFD
jgi:ferric-dicitrate binding protein FerR (iron transport regulator)